MATVQGSTALEGQGWGKRTAVESYVGCSTLTTAAVCGYHSVTKGTAYHDISNSAGPANHNICQGGGLSCPLPHLPHALMVFRYRSATLNWHFRLHDPALITATIRPEEGLLLVTAQALNRRLELRVEAPLHSFERVGGPTRAGFVPHSVESYSATATAGGCVGARGLGCSCCCA